MSDFIPPDQFLEKQEKDQILDVFPFYYHVLLIIFFHAGDIYG